MTVRFVVFALGIAGCAANYSRSPCVDNCGNNASCQASCQEINKPVDQQPFMLQTATDPSTARRSK